MLSMPYACSKLSGPTLSPILMFMTFRTFLVRTFLARTVLIGALLAKDGLARCSSLTTRRRRRPPWPRFASRRTCRSPRPSSPSWRCRPSRAAPQGRPLESADVGVSKITTASLNVGAYLLSYSIKAPTVQHQNNGEDNVCKTSMWDDTEFNRT